MIHYRKILELNDEGISLKGIASSTEKSIEGSGRQPLNFDYIHSELAKPNVTLSHFDYEYEVECRNNNKKPTLIVAFYVITVNMQIITQQHHEYVESQVKLWKLIGPALLHSSLIEIQVRN